MGGIPALSAQGISAELPRLRRLRFIDLWQSLADGWRDFWERPSHLAFLGLIYPLVGTFLAVWSSGNNAWPLLFPLASGFALVGPFAALPIYEMSRLRELGEPADWRRAFNVFRTPAFASLVGFGVALLIVFTAWIMTAQFLYESLFGPGFPANFVAFVDEVLLTAEGRALILWGNVIGFGFAALVLMTSIVSIPLLLDRDVGVAIAVITSVRVTFRNPVTVSTWGLIVALILFLGALPLLVGLSIAVPVLGHASWHLYRRAVEPDVAAR